MHRGVPLVHLRAYSRRAVHVNAPAVASSPTEAPQRSPTAARTSDPQARYRIATSLGSRNVRRRIESTGIGFLVEIQLAIFL